MVEQVSGPSSWGRALRRAVTALLPRRRVNPRNGWSVLVPVVTLLAGVLFTATVRTANGTDLRNDRRPELSNLITDRERAVAAPESRAADLRRQIRSETAAQAASDAGAAHAQARGAPQPSAAGPPAPH